MFRAIVLACQITHPTNCTQISDDGYINQTFGECSVRVETIATRLPRVLSGFKVVAWRCEKKKEINNDEGVGT
jgi:hypothetical protein